MMHVVFLNDMFVLLRWDVANQPVHDTKLLISAS